MKRSIRIFKSLEEQQLFHLKEMRATTPLERFIRLFQMQKFSRHSNPSEGKIRSIIIHKYGRTQ